MSIVNWRRNKTYLSPIIELRKDCEVIISVVGSAGIDCAIFAAAFSTSTGIRASRVVQSE
jgi:hypothetical protein